MMFILTVCVELGDQTGKYEARICGVFTSKDLANAAIGKIEVMHPIRRTKYKVTKMEINKAADWGQA